MKKNYYDEKIENIYLLISQKNYKQAISLIKEELRMPYIPKIYEEKIIKIMDNIKSENTNETNNTSISKDVAIEYLMSNEEEKESMALEFLREHNLRNDKDLFKKRLETWPLEKNILKAYLFELLVEQEIDMEINFNGINMNPLKNGSILNHIEVQKTMDSLSKIFEKNPSLMNLSLDEFQRFLLISYPAIPENGKLFAIEISCIINSMFDDKIKLSNTQKRIKELLLR